MVKIKKALISVADKTDIIPLAKTLEMLKVEIIATGGTRKVLEKNGITTTEISKLTGNPEAFDGRMKTISYKLESALLFDRKKDANEAKELGIQAIDLVICNLYPFAKIKKSGGSIDALIENIDIGGPTMIRAAAKNYEYVTVVTDVNDYEDIISELKESSGSISSETR